MRPLLIACALMFPLSASAQDYPFRQTVFFGTVDDASLTTFCTLAGEGRIDCDFVQTTVSRAGNDGDFNRDLEASITNILKSDDEFDEKMCEEMRIATGAIETGIVPDTFSEGDEFIEYLSTMPSVQKSDYLLVSRAVVALCETPNHETAEAFLRATHDIKIRTREITSRSFKQTFITKDGGATWFSNQGPTGDCNVIQISRFEKAKDHHSAWVYYTRKVVTNKEGSDLSSDGLTSCDLLNEREFFYDWKESDRPLNCAYIKFGY